MQWLRPRPAHYRFSHRCEVPLARRVVRERLLDLEHYPQWWPQVRAVARIDDDNALVVCRSVLPYDLELHLHARAREEHVLEVDIDGAIRGTARWSLAQPDGAARTTLVFEQEVETRTVLLTLASYVARPLLAWNHARMMRGAERGLAQSSAASTAS